MKNKETLEELALKIIPDKSTKGWIDSFSATERIGFIKGYQLAQQELYSEEDMKNAFNCGFRIGSEDELNPSYLDFKEFINQYKKK